MSVAIVLLDVHENVLYTFARDNHSFGEIEMDAVMISMDEFEAAMTEGKKRAPYGQNRVLLKKAEAEPAKLVFEDEKKALSKLTALSVVRRKMNAQVRMFRRGNAIFLGPGDYVPSNRSPRAK
jgi:hypothetical protein